MERDLPGEIGGKTAERVYRDGRVGEYRDNITTPAATCKRNYITHSRLDQVLARNIPAPGHNPLCVCGYRIVRDQSTLLEYADYWAAKGSLGHVDYHATIDQTFAGWCIVECFGSGDVAYRDLTDPEPPGTVRVEKLTLGSAVYLPHVYGRLKLTDGLARKIRSRYGVRVKRIDRDFSREAQPADKHGWHESGHWGKDGAAGVVLAVNEDGRNWYLLLRSAQHLPGQKGLLGLPGGACEKGESFWQAAVRETREEVGLDISKATAVGEIPYTHESGWSYRNFVVHLDEMPTIKRDPSEVEEAMWVTAGGLLARRDQMVPGLAAKLDDILTIAEPPMA